VAWSAISSFDPDVLVVDTYPAGSFEELLPVLRWRRQRNVFVFREQRPEHAGAELMQATLRLYDRVIVPHGSADEAGPIPEPHKAVAVGPILIRERRELLGRDEARERIGAAREARLAYVSFGGGGDSDAPDALELAAEVVKEAGLVPVVGAGPLARRPHVIPGALTLSERQPAIEVLAAFDVAIAGAGYNSVHELLFAGVPSVFVPFERQVDDQLRRAQQVQAKGAAICCPRLDKASLLQALREALDPARAKALHKSAQKLVPEGGAEKAAKAIRELA
jgi:UDP:flavonoid glycosyltransferase YjiC (YdhE family)